MSAIRSLRAAVAALSRAPVLLLGGIAYALVVLPQRALQLATVPLLPGVLQLVTFFVTPFVVAGVLGMAAQALDGEPSLDDFASVGRARYVDLLLATLVELGVQLAFGVAFVVLALLVVFAGAGGLGVGTLVGAGVLSLLVLAYVVVLFLIQFYPVAVVVDDVGPVDAVTESVRFVRENVLATLGYSVLTVVVGTLSALPVSGFVAYRVLSAGAGSGGPAPGPIAGGVEAGGATGPAPSVADLVGSGSGLGLSTPEVAALSLVSVATTALFFAFRHTYATAFYRQSGRTVEERVLETGSEGSAGRDARR
jgi:hypothetical protein